MRRFIFLTIAGLLGIGLAFGEFSLAFSQESEEFTLEEITVTAQKREENQQKVPIAMEVISGEVLKEQGRNDIDEILNNVSSVLINTAEDGLRVSIRGMSNDNAIFDNMQTSKPTVAVNKDGIYTNRNSGNTDLFDIERVEVLFGPQSTLYASASPGGVVNVITSDPKLDKVEGSGTLEYGNYSQLKAEGSVNAPFNDFIALRAAFSTSVHDGYLSNGGDDEDIKSGRLKTLYKPNEKVSIVVTGEISKSKTQGFSGAKKFIDQDDATFTDGTPLDDPWTGASDEPRLATNREQKRIFAQIEYDLGYIGMLSLSPAYTRATNSNSGNQTTTLGPPGMGGTEIQTFSTLNGVITEKSFEARMSSSEDFPFKWIMGFNIYKSLEHMRQWYFELNDDDPDLMDSNRLSIGEQNTTALYGNVTYPIVDAFRLTVGFRKTWDELINEGFQWNGVGDPSILEPGRDGRSVMEYKDPDYKIGVEYDLAENSMLFADWSTSYRVNGKGPDKVMPPEKLKAYTVGAKNRFFGNKLQLNASAYYYDYRNFFTVGDPVDTIVDYDEDGQVDTNETERRHDLGQLTTGDAEVYGFDLQTNTIITRNDRLDFSVSYVKKKFADIIFDYTLLTNNLGLADMTYNGLEMTNAPHWTINFNYSHNFQLPNGGVLTPRLEYRFQSSYLMTWQREYISLAQYDDGTYYYYREPRGDIIYQKAYRMGDLSVLYAHPGGAWTLNFYMKNIENYALKRSLIGQGGGELRLSPPRTYGGVITVRF
ncbi:MAG: TonB-dependent receptor [Deltaproteobacteria bacterium]|nr:TonB-dependent receptor [Deltaproteobacteria bacterium]